MDISDKVEGTEEEKEIIQFVKDLPTPCFIINRYAFVKNCKVVLDRIKEVNKQFSEQDNNNNKWDNDKYQGITNKFRLRPHIKAHKTIEGAIIQCTGEKDADNISNSLENSSNNNYGAYKDIVTGFVTSTLPEIKLIVDYATEDRYRRNRRNPLYNIIYGIPIGVDTYKLRTLYDLQQRLRRMNSKSVIHIVIDHLDQIKAVEHFLQHQQSQLVAKSQIEMKQEPLFSVFLKLDTGYHRAGVPPTSSKALEMAMRIIQSEYMNFYGLYTYCGHAYSHSDTNKIRKIAYRDIESIAVFLKLLKKAWEALRGDIITHFDADDLIVSIGSTPSLFCHLKQQTNRSKESNRGTLEEVGTIKSSANVNDKKSSSSLPVCVFDIYNIIPNTIEIHPGNYTFYDRQQLYTGACVSDYSISGRVLTRVISHYEDRNTCLLDAGATSLTKETTPQGDCCSVANFGGDELQCYHMSQEVTVVRRRKRQRFEQQQHQLHQKKNNNSDFATTKHNSTQNKNAHNNDGNQDNEFPFQNYPIGSMLTLLPNNGSSSAACFNKYYIIDDPSCTFDLNQPIIDQWIPCTGFAP